METSNPGASSNTYQKERIENEVRRSLSLKIEGILIIIIKSGTNKEDEMKKVI